MLCHQKNNPKNIFHFFQTLEMIKIPTIAYNMKGVLIFPTFMYWILPNLLSIILDDHHLSNITKLKKLKKKFKIKKKPFSLILKNTFKVFL
jgi:hypothetical protein